MKKIGKLEIIEFLNGLVFYSPVSLLVRTQAGVSMSEFFILQAILSFVILSFEIPTGMLTDKIGYKNSLALSQILLLLSRTLLLTAFLSQSFIIFVIEAVVEGISSCFLSGTNSAYLYNICDEDEFLTRSAKIANFGTAGFIISTVSYVLIYHYMGITGLIVATMIACLLACPLSFMLPKESMVISETKQEERTVVFFKDINIILLILFSAAFSIGGIVISFFYVDKLMNLGISEEWMSLIIILYSLCQMLAEKILDSLNKQKYRLLLLLSSLLAGALMFVFAVSNNAVIILTVMVIMPLLMDLPMYVESEIINNYIDKSHRQDRRATILSVMNMGGNILEVIFLLASAFIANIGLSFCFILSSLLIMALSIAVYCISAKIYADNAPESVELEKM